MSSSDSIVVEPTDARSCKSFASWHGVIHGVVGIVTLLVLLVAPFIVARCLRRAEAWADLGPWSIGLGIAIDLAMPGFVSPEVGLAQRFVMLAGSVWIGPPGDACPSTGENARSVTDL